jgi:glycyl-tRNA synthetase
MFTVWREHFVIADDMLEVSCPSLTPYIVLKNSGHVDRFTDVLVKDVKTQDPFRADHLLEEYIAKTLADPKANAELKKELEKIRPKVEEMKVPEFREVFKKFNIKSPETGNDLSEAEDFNLMFKTQIGPWADAQAFLRPETAQSLITNFKRLYDFNYGKLPFAAANIGLGFRNEISPRQGLIRVREFEMGEIEHFVDPLDKSHPKYNQVVDVEVTFFPAKEQLAGEQPRKLKISDALNTKVVTNETMAYFIARVYQYMKLVGIKEECVRFRQHKPKEMAHYASDCWDCELLTSYGWVESVGIADRSAYDLECHSKGIKRPIVASRPLDKPREENQVKIVLNKGDLAKIHKKETALIIDHFENMSNEDKTSFKTLIEEGKEYKFTEAEKEFTIKKSDVTEFKVTKVNVIEEKFVPGIIEPAFGFGRILFALLEQNFHVRDEKRTMFLLPANISPIKCSILPLMAKDELLQFVSKLGNSYSNSRD